MFDSDEINKNLEVNKARHLASRQKRRNALNSKITPEEKELLLNMYKELTSREDSKLPEEEEEKIRAKDLDTIAKDFISLYTTIKKERKFAIAEFDVLVSYLAPADPRIKIREDEKFDAEHAIKQTFRFKFNKC